MPEESSIDFVRLLALLREGEVRFIVVGGVAGILAGAPLTTQDLDVVYDPASDNVERLEGALRQIHARYRDPAGHTSCRTSRSSRPSA